MWNMGEGIVLVIFFFFFFSDLKKSRMATTRYLVIESCCVVLPSIILYKTDSATYRKTFLARLLSTQGDTDTSEKSGYTLYGGHRSVHTTRTVLPVCHRLRLQSRL